ncbi:SCP2 sterol-binding domain-containing protein [Brevibacillus ruminantium]|uniref:SCP2 sterol-binding domain-containing protein n=1 Tax=Brevibacillus ruminantium TaxID=2950604 RepID=A0ABY4WR66_9BACL|nr:SCP2 sterol-binding domain-containing protein [Brevibacillus ruminantium]USG67909.1 SCP2 sterol-binding domain-containing protein [Brevibacillus ruminantium]
MSVKETIDRLAEKMNANPEYLGGLQAVFHFHLKESGLFQIAFSGNAVSVCEGGPDQAACSLELSDANFVKLVNGELNPTTAFMMGKLKIKGDLGLSLKLQSILQKYQ